MTKIEQVIEALEDARIVVADTRLIDQALTTLRSLTEQGDGPYFLQKITKYEWHIKNRGTGDMFDFIFIDQTSDDEDLDRIEQSAQCRIDALNAAFNAGRLSAELQRGEPVAPTVDQMMQVVQDWASEHKLRMGDPTPRRVIWDALDNLRERLAKLMAPKS